MIALDTNLLVYAHREDSPWHDAAYARLTELAEGRALWTIPWPCLHESLALVTHPRIYAPPRVVKISECIVLHTVINLIKASTAVPSRDNYQCQTTTQATDRRLLRHTADLAEHAGHWPA